MTYNPSNPMFTGSNKSYATQGKPDTAKQWYADSVTFENRPFTSRAEVLAYFDTALKRKGVTGAVVVEEEIPSEYWWPDITKLADVDLIKKINVRQPFDLGIYDEDDINDEGFLEIKTGDISSVTGKKLLSATVNSIPVEGAYFYPLDDNISGFGNYIGSTGLTIELTFI